MKPAPAAEAVLEAFGLPGPVVSMRAVAGAWSNRVHRLETVHGTYAVKQMCNPWGNPRWGEWLDEAWRFELRARGAGVPAPEPIPSPGEGCLAWVDAPGGEPVPVRVHRWVEGAPARDAPVDDAVAAWAGRVLADLHGLAVVPTDRAIFPVATTETADRWPELCAAAHRAGALWAEALDDAAAAVSTAAALATEAARSPGAEVMTHGDLDHKNLVLTSGGPVLCDWDVAMPLAPRRELADVALSLGGWHRLDVSRRVVGAYAAAGGGETEIEPPDLGESLMRGLDWIAFNVECAIGRRTASPERAALACRLIPGLLAEFPRRAAMALRVGGTLRP